MRNMQETPYLSGFTAGELSPWLSTRFDLQAYRRGAQRIENFLVQPYGGLQRRSGTECVEILPPTIGTAARLIPFVYSESDALMLLIYPGSMHVYRNGVRVLKNSEVYAPKMPWATVEMVESLRAVQVNDVVYMTCPQLEPFKLMRYADDNWKCETLVLEPYPRETYVAQEAGLQVLMQPGGRHAQLQTDTYAPAFTPEMELKEYIVAEAQIPSRTLFMNEKFIVAANPLPDLSTTAIPYCAVCYVENESTGLYDYYTCIRSYDYAAFNGSNAPEDYPNYFIAGVMRLDENGMPYEVCGDWELRTHGEWDGVWELWRSYDDVGVDTDFRRWNWTRIKTFGQTEYSERQNWALSGSEDVPCRMMLVCKSAITAEIGAYMYFRILGATREYKMRILRYDSAHSAYALILTKHLGSAKSFYTRRWSFGAFGSRNGYPRFAAFYQGRLWFGGARGLPTTLVASSVNDYQNFRVSSSDGAALHLTLASADQSRISWICPARHLLVGSSEAEWTLDASGGGAISAGNAAFVRQSSVGSENLPACSMENTVFFVQRGGRRLREISYKLEADGYTSTDVSLLSEHLFATGVKEWVVQHGASSHLWVLLNDGSFAVLTTNVEQQVTAWQRVSFPGRKGIHLATLVQGESHEDEVWFVLQNEKNGIVSIERMLPGAPCLDGAACQYIEADGVLYPGIHLSGLSGFAYPENHPELAVAITIDESGACRVPGATAGIRYHVGASFDSLLQTMPMESEFSFNAVRQLGRVKLRLLESDPQFSYRTSSATRWELYDPAREGFSYPYTGAIHVSHLPIPRDGQGFCLRVNSAANFKLLSLTAEIDYHGK